MNDDLLEALGENEKKLFNDLNSLNNQLSSYYLSKWKRSLPFSEMLSNRWEKAGNLKFGAGTSIYDDVLVLGEVNVGEKTWIGPYVVLDGSGKLIIGNNCSISAGVHIYTHNSVKWAVSGGKTPYDYRPTIIGNNCFIGPHAIIQMGITIGDHCIVGANSFVNSNLPANSISVGSPAKTIGRVKIDSDGEVSLVYDESQR